MAGGGGEGEGLDEWFAGSRCQGGSEEEEEDDEGMDHFDRVKRRFFIRW